MTPYLQMLLREGVDAVKAGQKERARQLLMQVVETDETNLQAWLWLSSVVDNQDKRVCLENVLTLDPNNEPARAGLAWLDQRAPRSPSGSQEAISSDQPAPQEAARVLCPFCSQKVSKRATTCRQCGLPLFVNCPACTTLAEVQASACPQCGFKLGNYRQGAAYFAGLAAGYQERRNDHQALKTWQIVQALQPNYPQLCVHLGEAQAALGQVNEAMASFQSALEQEPGQLTACLALGEIMGQMHRWQEAESLYAKALNTAPDSPQAHYGLGLLMMGQGKLREAFVHLRRATLLDPHNGVAWLRLGKLYELAREFHQAARAYERVMTLLPPDSLSGQEARQRLETLYPPLPDAMAAGWFELLRQMMGPVLICVLTVLLDAGLRPWWVSLAGWVALVLAVLGAFLWVSATSLPRNPILRQFLNQQGLQSPTLRTVVATLGAVCWLAAMAIILIPFGKSMPEVPS